MILNDRELRAMLKASDFLLDPFEERLVQPSSIDLRLDSLARCIRANTTEFDVRDDATELYDDILIPDTGHVLAPHATLIGQTAERMRIPATCQGMIAQRSSLVRIGLFVSSSLINPGYEGKLPLMVCNLSPRPIRLYAGLPVCQIVLLTLSGRPDVTYAEKADAKYHGERDALPSQIAADARKWLTPVSPRFVDSSKAQEFVKRVTVREGGDE